MNDALRQNRHHAFENNSDFLSHERKEIRASKMAKERSGIHLIAEMAKVSIGTVDRALHGRGGIKESTRQRILQVARQIGYTPNLRRALCPLPKRALESGCAC